MIPRLFSLLIVVAAIRHATLAQDMPVPVDIQFPIFVKILTFDRALSERPGEKVQIGVLFQGDVKASSLAKEEFFLAASESSLKLRGRKIDCVSIEMADTVELRASLVAQRIDVLYITPMRLVNVRSIAALAGALKVLTITGVPDYLDEGLAIGIGSRGDRPSILVNLSQAKSQGADLSAQLLKLARITH